MKTHETPLRAQEGLKARLSGARALDVSNDLPHLCPAEGGTGRLAWDVRWLHVQMPAKSIDKVSTAHSEGGPDDEGNKVWTSL
jgi:hypothetical protein